jgi:hypothetical protein
MRNLSVSEARAGASSVVPLQTPGASAAAGNLRSALRQSVVMTDLLHAQLQVRVMSFLLAGSLLFELLDPLLLLLQPNSTMLYRVAMSTQLRAHGVALLFGGLAAALAPFLVLQIGWLARRRRGVVKFTCLVLAAAALLWFFLAWRCTHLDLDGAVSVIFARSGLGALFFSLALSFSLNAERVRSLLEERK